MQEDKPGEENYQQDRKNLFEPMTDAVKNTSHDILEKITVTFFKNNKILEILNGKKIDLLNDKCMIAPFSASSLVKLLKPENKNQIRFI